MFVSFVMVAEMAEFAFSARIHSVYLHSDGCRYIGVCIFSAVRQCVLASCCLRKWQNLRFQRGCFMSLGILSSTEIKEYMSSARIGSVA